MIAECLAKPGSVEDYLLELIDHSYDLVVAGLTKAQRKALTAALLRHVVLAMAALAVVAVTAAHARTPADQLRPGTTGRSGLIPLTVAEVKRLVNLTTRTWHSIEHHLRRLDLRAGQG
jgi:BarA-like signal transduction histidine kinase